MSHKVHYSDYTTSLFEYDFSIASHVLIDQCNASIIHMLVTNLDWSKRDIYVLDAGCGTGQVARMLLGVKGIKVEACDIDPAIEMYFKNNPETKEVKYYNLDILNEKLPRHYDAIIIRGVYHHIGKAERPILLENLFNQTDILINADEGILEYKSENERLKNCAAWYSFVIKEARRRHLYALAIMENDYFMHERLNTADDGGDLKESPSELIKDGEIRGLPIPIVSRFGNWNINKGGFYTAVYRKY